MNAHELKWRLLSLVFRIGGGARPTSVVDELARQRRFGNALFVHISDSLHARGNHARDLAPSRQLHFQPQLIARTHRTAEAGTIDAGENDHLAAAVFHFSK